MFVIYDTFYANSVYFNSFQTMLHFIYQKYKLKKINRIKLIKLNRTGDNN